MNKRLGFSLFELLITLVIMSILLMLAYPNYAGHFVHANRVEAEMTLEKIAASLEQYTILNNTYQGVNLTKLGYPEIIAKNSYKLSLVTTDSTFLIEAEPCGNQAEKDRSCGILSLNQLGERKVSGSGKVIDCW